MLSKLGEGLLVNEVIRAQPASRANSRGLSARLLAFAGKNKTYKKIGKRFKASSLLLGRKQGLCAVKILICPALGRDYMSTGRAADIFQLEDAHPKVEATAYDARQDLKGHHVHSQTTL